MSDLSTTEKVFYGICAMVLLYLGVFVVQKIAPLMEDYSVFPDGAVAMMPMKMQQMQPMQTPSHTPSDCDTQPIGFSSDKMIGLIYPPRLGPIQSPSTLPPRSPCASPFTAIYPDGYQVFYGAQPNLG
jgi:hypothetical protein